MARPLACVLVLLPALAVAQTWQALGPPGAGVQLVVSHPSDPDIVYAATFYSLYRSTDGGRSWSRLPLDFGNLGIQAVLVARDGTLLVSSDEALVRSTDGLVFDPVMLPSVPGVTAWSPTRIDPTNPQRIYVSDSNHLMYRTLDGGGSWAPINGWRPLTTDGLGDASGYALDPNGGPDVYLMTYTQLLHSGDGGDTWTLVGARPYPGEILSVQPGAPQHLFAGGGTGLQISLDGGATWEMISSSATRAMAFGDDPSTTVYTGSEGAGAHRVTLAAGTWTETNLSAGLQSLLVHGIAKTSAGVVVGLTWDGAEVYDETAGSWQTSTGLDEISPLAVCAVGGQVLAGFFYSSGGLLAHDGTGWAPATGGLSPPTIIESLLSYDGTVYAGGSAQAFLADSTSPWHWVEIATSLPGFVPQIVARGTGMQTQLYFATRYGGASSGVYFWDRAHASDPAMLLPNGLAGANVSALALNGDVLFAAADDAVWRITLADGMAERLAGSPSAAFALAVHGDELLAGDATHVQYANATSPTTWSVVDGPTSGYALQWDDTRAAFIVGDVGAVWRVPADHNATAIGASLPHRAVASLALEPDRIYAGVQYAGVFLLDESVAPPSDAGVSDAGALDSDGGVDGGTIATASGCGCRPAAPGAPSLASWVLVAITLTRIRRRPTRRFSASGD